MASATRAKRATGPLLCPFTVVVDTREQRPYTFCGITADVRDGSRAVEVPLHGGTLAVGDYSIQGMEAQVAIERKSEADFFGTLGFGRHRFARELARSEGMKFVCVVVESEWSKMIARPPPYSRLLPKTAWRSVIAWRVRYPWVQWCFCHSRSMGEVTTFRLLERFWKESQVKK